MKKFFILLLSIVLTMSFICFSPSLAQEQKLFQAQSIKSGVGFEYFSRTISWDDNQHSSKLKSNFFTLNIEFEFKKGLSLGVILGYSFSTYNELAFRELPISVQFGEDSESIGGYVLGLEIKKSIISAEKLRIDGLAQFFSSFGIKKEWEIPDLVVEGKVEGKPSWMRIAVGPVFTYTGFGSLSPYLYLNFNKLWGKFKMDETIENLTGNENKKISGKSSFCALVGFRLELTESISVKTEASFMPYKEGVDMGFMIKALYSF